jgi:hypothetical protein
MKKLLAVLLVLVFACAVNASAATKALSNKEMDQVTAGDWVVLNNADGSQSVADVYTTNNTLDLLEQSQSSIKAVSNANVIDGAAAVQSNVISASGSAVNINGANNAELMNYRPGSSSKTSDVTKTSTTSVDVDKFGKTSGEASSSAVLAGSSASSSSSASSFATKNYSDVENSNANGALAITDKAVGKTIEKSGVASVMTAVATKVETDVEGSGAAAASASDDSSVFGAQRSSQESESISKTDTDINKETSDTESTVETRDSKGANNHIYLEETSQQNINAVSNLNLVGGAAAIQANVADNVGVTGTVSYSNSAVVISGI